MKTYKLIDSKVIKLEKKSFRGLPPTLTREAAPPPTPDGYAYVEDIEKPNDAPEGKQYVRELTATTYGWKLQDAPPPPEPPEVSVTRIQMMDVLIDNDLYDSVETMIAAMPDGTPLEAKDKKKMEVWWKNAPNFRRNNARIITMAAALGLTEEQVDEMFALAQQVD